MLPALPQTAHPAHKYTYSLFLILISSLPNLPSNQDLFCITSLLPYRCKHLTMAVADGTHTSHCASEVGSAHSVCSNTSFETLVVPATAYPAPESTISTTRTFTFGLNGATRLRGQDHCSHAPLTVANLACLDATQLVVRNHNNIEGPSDGGEVIEKYWYCCYCSHGPYNIRVLVSCVFCNNHEKCSDCREERVVQK
jgi:hypothetical protein